MLSNLHLQYLKIYRNDYLKRSVVDSESASFAPYYDMINKFMGTRDTIRPRMLIQRNMEIIDLFLKI